MIGNVDTLNPGESATVSSSIDPEQDIVYFNFGIPKGDKGDTGDINLINFEVENGVLKAYDEEGHIYYLGTVAMEPKGEYSATTSYEKLNTVLYNDSTYMALKSSLGNPPTDTEYWQLIGGGVTKEYLEDQTIDNLDSSSTTKPLSAKQGNNLNKSKVEVFDTVALMKAANLKNGMTAQTLGYYAVNDGGQGKYIIVDDDTLVDDGGSVHVLNNGLRAKLILNEYVTPEIFGAYGDGTHNDTTSFNNAILQTKKLILSNKTYKLTQLLINKELTIEGNESTLIDDTSVNEFIKITKPDTIFNVYLNNIKINCSHSDIGIYNNGCHLNGENVTISNSITKNIQIVKTGVYGDCKLNNIFSKSSPIGIQLDATDCFISNYFGYNCLTHIKNNNGVNHFNNVHGWNYNNGTDQVTGSTLIDTKADLMGCDIYADTLESVITVPNGYQYTSILLQNVNYFLNTSSYPNTQALPEVIKNYSNYQGYCRIDGLILNANGWVNSSGIYPRLSNYPSRISITNATLTGWYTLAYNPSGVNDDFNANQFSATTNYLNPNTRKYNKKGYKTHIYMTWNLTTSIPNNAQILTLDFTNGSTLYPMFNNITKSNSTMKAIFHSTSTTGLCYNLGISMTGNVIYVCNNTGITLGNEGNYGDIEIYIDYDVN